MVVRQWQLPPLPHQDQSQLMAALSSSSQAYPRPLQAWGMVGPMPLCLSRALSKALESQSGVQGLPADPGARRGLGRQVGRQARAGIWRGLVVPGDRTDAPRGQPGPANPALCARLHGHRGGRGHACHEQPALQVASPRQLPIPPDFLSRQHVECPVPPSDSQ